MTMEYILNVDTHDRIVTTAYKQRGYDDEECGLVTRLCRLAAQHGIKTHNGIKALHLDDVHGSGKTVCPGCVPGAQIQKKPGRFAACQAWDANLKLGQAVAFKAMDTAMSLADQYGVGVVSVDRAFHYLWGGGYVMEAARKGYIAYTQCTSTLTEVVPFEGVHPTLGTNPLSWGLPTMDAIGYPLIIDWATSSIAMGRVVQFAHKGQSLPPGSALDKDGNPTNDPQKVAALLPFGAHKGYGLGLLIELMAGLIGGSLPTLRGRADQNDNSASGEKFACNFFFQAIRPEALSCGAFARGRDQTKNVKAVIEDVLGHGNEHCMLPGQIEHEAAVRSEQVGGLIFTKAEIDLWHRIAQDAGLPFDPSDLKQVL